MLTSCAWKNKHAAAHGEGPVLTLIQGLLSEGPAIWSAGPQSEDAAME